MLAAASTPPVDREEGEQAPIPLSPSSAPPPLPLRCPLRLSAVRPSVLRASRASVSDARMREQLLPFLSSHPQVTAVDLRANGLSDEGLGLLLTQMAHPPLCSSIASLDLSGLTGFPSNAIGQTAASCLRAVLCPPSLSGLRTLRLSSLGRLSLRSAIVEARAFAAAPSLTSLDVSANGLGPSIVRCLCAQLSHAPHSRLTHLNLDRNDMGEACSAALRTLLLSSTSLTSLHVAHNRLSHATLTAIAQAIAPDTATLTRLSLDHNPQLCSASSELSPSPLHLLSAALSANVSLRWLSLTDCGVGRVEELGAALAANPTLTRLSLSSNPLSSAACSLLLSSLHRNTGLLSLSLCGLTLDDSVAPALSALLLRNPYLRQLRLSDNRLTDAFLTEVLQCVAHQPQCNLPFPGSALSRNHLTQRSLARLRALMQRNSRVQRAILLQRYRDTIDTLHSLPSQVQQCRADIEQLQLDCDRERAKEQQSQARVARQREELQEERRALLQRLQKVREERQLRLSEQSEELAGLSLRLSEARGLLKAGASNLRLEVVAEKKAQQQLVKQLSRQEALWDSLDEVRRSGDAVLHSLQLQSSAAQQELTALQEQLEVWAMRLTQLATRLVHRYYLALHAFAHSRSRAAAERGQQREEERPSGRPSPAPAAPQPHQPQPAEEGKAASAPLPLCCPSSLERFVPSLPPLGFEWDVSLADFVRWMFHTATPSATLAVLDSAISKRLPVIAFAQATVAIAEQRRGGGEDAISLTCSSEPPHTQHQSHPPHRAASPTTSAGIRPSTAVVHPRPLLSQLGVESVELSSSGTDAAPLLSAASPLFTGCCLLVQAVSAASPLHPNEGGGAATSQPQSPAPPPPASASSPPSSVLVDARLSMSWAELIQAIASAHRLDPAQLLPPSPDRRLWYLPGLRLALPWAEYVVDTPEPPRLSLEEALAELGGGGKGGMGGGAASASASTASLRASAAALSSSALPLTPALPSLTDELSSLLATLSDGGGEDDDADDGVARSSGRSARPPSAAAGRATQGSRGLHSPPLASAMGRSSPAHSLKRGRPRGRSRVGIGRSLRPAAASNSGAGHLREVSPSPSLSSLTPIPPAATAASHPSRPPSRSHSPLPPCPRPSSFSSSSSSATSLQRRSSLSSAAAPHWTSLLAPTFPDFVGVVLGEERQSIDDDGASAFPRLPFHRSRARAASTTSAPPLSHSGPRDRRSSSMALTEGREAVAGQGKTQPHPLLHRPSLVTIARWGYHTEGEDGRSGAETRSGGRETAAPADTDPSQRSTAHQGMGEEAGEDEDAEEAEDVEAAAAESCARVLAPADDFLLRLRSLTRPLPPSPPPEPAAADVVDAPLPTSGSVDGRAQSLTPAVGSAAPLLPHPPSSLAEATQLLLRSSSMEPLLTGASELALQRLSHRRASPVPTASPALPSLAAAEEVVDAEPECASLALQPPLHLQSTAALIARSQLFAGFSSQAAALQADFTEDVAYIRCLSAQPLARSDGSSSSSSWRDSRGSPQVEEEVEGEGQQPSFSAASARASATFAPLQPSALSAIRPWPRLCTAQQRMHTGPIHLAHPAPAGFAAALAGPISVG